jgi:hypothetical protein
MIDPWIALLVFVSAALIDAVGTLDIRRTAQGKAGEATLFTMLGYVLGGITLWTFIQNPWYGIPEIIGAGVGAYVTIKWDNRGVK